MHFTHLQLLCLISTFINVDIYFFINIFFICHGGNWHDGTVIKVKIINFEWLRDNKLCMSVAARINDLPLVEVKQLSRFLAVGLCLHCIPIARIRTPPCFWVLAWKQGAHVSWEITTSPGQLLKSLFYADLLQLYATATFVWRTAWNKIKTKPDFAPKTAERVVAESRGDADVMRCHFH